MNPETKAQEPSPTIEEMNRVIAFFDNKQLPSGSISDFEENEPIPVWVAKRLKYHSDWNELMRVVEKISRLEIGDDIEYVKYAYPRTFGMLNDDDGKIMVRLNGHQLFYGDTLIQATHESVFDFCQWYNQRKEEQ